MTSLQEGSLSNGKVQGYPVVDFLRYCLALWQPVALRHTVSGLPDPQLVHRIRIMLRALLGGRFPLQRATASQLPFPGRPKVGDIFDHVAILLVPIFSGDIFQPSPGVCQTTQPASLFAAQSSISLWSA